MSFFSKSYNVNTPTVTREVKQPMQLGSCITIELPNTMFVQPHDPYTIDTSSVYNPEFMMRAIELSRKAGVLDKTGGPFGAVVVKDNKIIGEGYNRVVELQMCTRHAEIIAIENACLALGTHNLAGCVLYTSSEPCVFCSSALEWSRISQCWYAATVQDAETYGNFRDKAMAEGKVQGKINAVTGPEYDVALEVWKDYDKLDDKVPY